MAIDLSGLPDKGIDLSGLPDQIDLSGLPHKSAELYPEGSPEQQDILRARAGNLMAPPGAFARQPTLGELVQSALPQQPEEQVPMAPPIPEQEAYQQGVLPYVVGAGQFVNSLIPKSWEEAAQMVKPPMGGVDVEQENRLGAAWRGEYGPEEQTKAILGTLAQAAPLVHLPFMETGIPGRGGLRTEPLVMPDLPPSPTLGPGTTATDVSAALQGPGWENRFQLVPEPKAQVAPAPSLETVLSQLPEGRFGTETPEGFVPQGRTGVVPPSETANIADLIQQQTQGPPMETSSRAEPTVAEAIQQIADQPVSSVAQAVQEVLQGQRPAPATEMPALEIPEADKPYAGMTPQPVEAPPVQTTALPESGFSTERAQKIYGDDAVLINQGKSAAEWKAIGQADTRNPYDVLQQARKRGIATPDEAANLRAEHQRLLERARQQYGTPEYKDLADNAVDFLNASKQVVHGPASDLFRGLQEADEPTYMSPADYDNILRERQMEPTADESATFKKVTDEVTNGDTQAREAAANGQEALKTYRPNEVVPFDEAADYVKKQIKDLTEPCAL